MDQSALTRTSRLTATACDRERGFGGRERQSSRDGAGSPARRIPRVRANKRGGKTMRSRERPPRASEAGARTFLAAKDFFAPANWGRTAVEEAMACIVDDSCVVKGRGRVRICPAARAREASSRRRSMYPYRSLVSRGARERQSARAECDARRPRRQKGRTVCPLLENAIRGRETKPPGDGSRASRVGFFSRLLVSATVITDS